jgi:hypothetical protein
VDVVLQGGNVLVLLVEHQLHLLVVDVAQLGLG